MAHSSKEHCFFGLPEQCLRAIPAHVHEEVKVKSTHRDTTMLEDLQT